MFYFVLIFANWEILTLWPFFSKCVRIFSNIIRDNFIGGASSTFIEYIGFHADDQPPRLIYHPLSSKYLSVGPNDKFLLLHPNNCRTSKYTLWTCENGQLKNMNGKYVKFMTLTQFDALTDIEPIKDILAQLDIALHFLSADNEYAFHSQTS